MKRAFKMILTVTMLAALFMLAEICANLLIIVWIILVVALVEHGQDRFSVPEVGWICFDMCFQSLEI